MFPALFKADDETKPSETTTPSESLVFLWFHKILGLLVTTLAISLGAPFWFDLMNNLIRLYQRIPTNEEQASE